MYIQRGLREPHIAKMLFARPLMGLGARIEEGSPVDVAAEEVFGPGGGMVSRSDPPFSSVPLLVCPKVPKSCGRLALGGRGRCSTALGGETCRSLWNETEDASGGGGAIVTFE